MGKNCIFYSETPTFAVFIATIDAKVVNATANLYELRYIIPSIASSFVESFTFEIHNNEVK